jgi:holo-[acyl-carrier protein] synthase
VILGIGTDLIEVGRLERAVARQGNALLEALFRPSEIEDAGRARRPGRSWAARFAAKEALLKALGTGWANGISWRDVEVTEAGESSAAITLHGEAAAEAGRLGVQKVLVSVTTTSSVAAAVVVVVGRGQ